MKFTRDEVMQKSAVKWADLDKETRDNADELIRRVNALDCPIPRQCTSFIRSRQRQIDIYRNKAALKESPFSDGVFVMAKVPLGSAHLKGFGIDVWDADMKLKEWVKANAAALEKCGLWCEDFAYTPDWVHFQSAPPKSGNRFFKPF